MKEQALSSPRNDLSFSVFAHPAPVEAVIATTENTQLTWRITSTILWNTAKMNKSRCATPVKKLVTTTEMTAMRTTEMMAMPLLTMEDVVFVSLLLPWTVPLV